MPLRKNDTAPDFSLEATSGNSFELNAFKGQPLIIFFYPKNFTKVCTKEVCEFRDAFSEFKGLDVKVLGVSQDTISSHLKFKEEFNLPFDLLSDPKGKVAKKYKATIPVIGMNRRVTYLLDGEHVIRAVYEDMFSARGHIEAMLTEMKK